MITYRAPSRWRLKCKGVVVATWGDKFAIYWNEDQGAAWIELSGFWDVADVASFLPAADTVIRRSRSRHGRALVLFDMAGVQVMTGALMANFMERGSQLVQPADKIAMICESSLVKM